MHVWAEEGGMGTHGPSLEICLLLVAQHTMHNCMLPTGGTRRGPLVSLQALGATHQCVSLFSLPLFFPLCLRLGRRSNTTATATMDIIKEVLRCHNQPID